MSGAGSGSRGRGSRVMRKGSSIKSALVSVPLSTIRGRTGGRLAADRGRAAGAHAAETQQRIAPIAAIFQQGSRRTLDLKDAESVMELMGDELDTTSSSRSTEISTTPTSNPVRRSSSSRPAVPGVVSSTPVCSNPTMTNLFSPETASALEDVVGDLGDDILLGKLEDEEDENLDMQTVVVGESEEDVAEGGFRGATSQQDFLEEEDDYFFDDEVLDATYQPQTGEVSSEEEDASVGLSRRIMIAGSGRRSSGCDMQQSSQPAASSRASTTSRSTQPPTKAAAASHSGRSGVKSKFTSPIWQFFTLSTEDKRYAICNLCKLRLSRGLDPSKYTTTCLLSHLARKHYDENQQLQEQKAGGTGSTHPHSKVTAQPSSKRPSRPHAPPAAAAGVQERTATASATTPSSTPDNTEAFSCSQSSSLASSCVSSASRGSKRQRQTLLHESYPGVIRAKSPHSRRIRQLNGLLAQAMSSQLLPYSLIQEGSVMRKLLQSAAPDWPLPSRHYFSRTAIPALHRYVMGNVERGLDYAVGERVHVTMDSWSSRCGTGRYLSFTAHWVALVEGGEEGKAAAATAATEWVVPPRGVRGNAAGSSDPVPSSGTPGVKHVHHSSSSAKPRHCQALLEMVSLGKDKLTADHVLAKLLQQQQSWLTPRGLRVGEVVSDNGANLLAAISRGNLTHIPCLAHVLNLVVQKFLRTYQGMDTLLAGARKVVGHFRRSGGASASLEHLQVTLALPRHRLIQDVPTRWNSTLAMLERLVEQRQAVSQYLRDATVAAMAGTRSHSNLPPIIPNDNWHEMQQVCMVLAPFQQATNMVSRDRSLLCEWVPLICLLDQALFTLLEEGEAALAQQEQQAAAQSTSGEGEEEEEEEEEEELEVADDEVEGARPSAAGLVRGWTEQEDAQGSEEDESTFESGGPNVPADAARLFPMAAHMLRCLRRDPRVMQMKQREDMLICMMLDPRLKGKLGQFLPPAEGDPARQMRDLQRSLVWRLEEAFPQPSTPPAVRVQPAQQQVPLASSRRTTDLLSLSKALYTMVELPREEVPAAAASSSQNQRLTRMVADYMGSFSGLDSDDPVDPMEYWVKRLDIWRELAQYALEVLSCPPSSVLSERCFSAAGGVVTEKRSRLSTESVDRLTFLKMNQSWVEGEFLAPVVGERGT